MRQEYKETLVVVAVFIGVCMLASLIFLLVQNYELTSRNDLLERTIQYNNEQKEGLYYVCKSQLDNCMNSSTSVNASNFMQSNISINKSTYYTSAYTSVFRNLTNRNVTALCYGGNASNFCIFPGQDELYPSLMVEIQKGVYAFRLEPVNTTQVVWG